MAENTERKIAISLLGTPETGLVAIPPSAKFRGTEVVKKFEGTVGAIAEEESQNSKWAHWGINDNQPLEIREMIEAVNMASAVMPRLIASMYGNGLIYYNNDDLHDGNTTVARAYNQEVENFLKKSRVATTWLPAQIADYRYNINAFSEMILSKDKSTITGISHKACEHTRVGKQNPKTLKIEKAFYSPYFSLGAEAPKNKTVEIPYLLPYEFHFDDEQKSYFKSISKKYKFIWHSKFVTPGSTYYGVPWWLALFQKKGWLNVAKNVPRIILAMQNNQVSIKYQILIPESYFTIRYLDWDTYTQEERDKRIDEFVDKINDMLEGVDNQYKSITTLFRDDPNFSMPQGKIEIVAIDDKAKTGTWIPDSNAADAQIVQGLGMHPSQMGLAPEGGKMGAGSGSDQRESYNTQIQNNTIDQAIVLEPLNFISDFNGWNVTFVIDHSVHTTTNDQESGIKDSENTITLE